MKETIDLLGKILTNILTALYEPFGFSLLLSFLAMFFYLYAYEPTEAGKGWKNAIVTWVSVKPSPAKTNRQAPTSLPVCLIIIIVFFGKIHPFPKCSLAFSVAFVQKQIAVWIIKLFRLLPLLEKCGFYNLKYPTVEIFARCGTICFYAVQDKISKEIFLIHRITVF